MHFLPLQVHIIAFFCLAYIASARTAVAYNAYPYPLPAAYSAFPAFRTVAPAAPALLPPPPPVARTAALVAAPAAVPAVRTAFPAAFLRSAPVAAAPVAAPLAAAPFAPAPVVAAPVAKLEYADTYPQYQYAYNIQDALTGDSKAQEEIREGGVVKGRYSLIEADGSRRTVNYYADPLNGFNAVIQKDVPVVAAGPAVVRAAPPPPAIVSV